MDADRWRKIEALFEEAADLAPDEQSVLLDSKCGNDSALKDEVHRLLARDRAVANGAEQIKGVIEAVASIRPAAPQEAQATGSWTGRKLGDYQIVREIGRGGMGVVFEAIRKSPEFEQRVALKIATRAVYSPEFGDRFRGERQILARLEHPNIARLIDGGTTEDGVPYFAMEFVDGTAIDQYVEAKHVSTEGRLQLFLQVCEAVEYAHQHLIVHRDIKPGNIMVTGSGFVRLLDFGIAKVLDTTDAAKTSTSLGAATPGYCSPEQWMGEPVTTRTDVFSLGLVLYKLLTGANPRSSDITTPATLHQEICETDTPLPSASALVRGDNSLARRLRGDLDTIVQTATSKKPERRYSSVTALAEDLRRHLDSRPIEARAESAWYRTEKFFRRHWAATGAAAAIVLALAGGVISTRYQAQRAERRFQQVRGIANRLLMDVQDEIRDLAGSAKAQRVVLNTAVEYLDGLAKEAEGDRELQLELANGYAEVAKIAKDQSTPEKDKQAEVEMYSAKARSLIDQFYSEDRIDPRSASIAVDVYSTIGRLLMDSDRQKEAMEALERARQMSETALARYPNESILLNAAAQAYSNLVVNGRTDDALVKRHLPRYMALEERLSKDEPGNAKRQSDLAVAYAQAGNLMDRQGSVSASIPYFRKAVAALESATKIEPNNATMRRNLIIALANVGDGLMGPLRVTSYGGPSSKRIEIEEGPRIEALQTFQKAVEQAEWRLSRDPKSTTVLVDIAVIHGRGAVAFTAAEARQAVDWIEKALGYLQQVEQAEPLLAYRFGVEFHGYLAERWRQLGDPGKAVAEWRKAEAKFHRGLRLAQDDYVLQNTMIKVYWHWAIEMNARGSAAEALRLGALVNQAADTFVRSTNSAPRARGWQARLASWYAGLLGASGRPEPAKEFQAKALGIWRNLSEDKMAPPDLTQEAGDALRVAPH